MLPGSGARLGAIVDVDEQAAVRRTSLREQGCEPPVVHDRLGTDLVEELRNLGRVVVVVDVERHRTGSVRADHRLDVLGAVRTQDGDRALPALPPLQVGTLAAHAETVRSEERGEPLRPLLDLRVRAPHRRPDEHLSVGHCGRHHVERVRE